MRRVLLLMSAPDLSGEFIAQGSSLPTYRRVQFCRATSISRRTGLSRNTIRKYLRAGESEPHYAKRVSPSKLDPFAGKLAGWLKAEAGRSRKQRRTVKQMHADLQTLGYPGSYNRVAAFVRPALARGAPGGPADYGPWHLRAPDLRPR